LKGLLDWWEARCHSSGALRFVDVNLRGVGQVMFQNHPLAGLLFVVAIGWGSSAAGAPQIAIGGLVALVAGSATAYWLRVDEADIRAGLYGFNAYLVGLALPTFMASSAAMWIYVALGGTVSAVAMQAMANVFKTWSAPALTAPFVLVAWLMLLATNAFANLEGALWASGIVAPLDPAYTSPLRFGEFLQGTLLSISQVFLKGNGIAALLLLAGLAVGSLAAAAWGLAGAVIAVSTAHLLGAESDLIAGGLMGFSPVLTAIALGAVFCKPGWRVAIYAVVGTVFTVLVQGALNVLVTPFAIPTLTAPFVLVTWTFLLGRAKLDSE
jgi:urea transporter